MRLRTNLLFLALAVSVPLFQGCSGESLKTVPVYGTVTFAGREPPPKCDLVFKPLAIDGPKRPSFADRGPDGNYRVRAFKDSKGLIPGTYRVEVNYHDLKSGANPALESSWTTSIYDAGELKVPADSGGVEYNIEVRRKG